MKEAAINQVFLFSYLVFSIYACKTKSAVGPERTTENGVEVIAHGLEPCTIRGEASRLKLEQKLVIDFEDPALAEVKITKIWSFDVDSKGNISVWCRRSISKGHIYMGNSQSGYQIWIYDLERNPMRRIRKDYRPAIQYFFPEDQGRLFVMTF